MANHPNRSSARKTAWNPLRGAAALLFLAAFVFAALSLAPRISAQTTPHVTGVDPAEGKVSDSVTIAGDNLGKDSVVAVFLSDDKDDHKAAIVDQAADKIVMKVPQVKAGVYNVSIQVADKILIMPVRFTVD